VELRKKTTAKTEATSEEVATETTDTATEEKEA